MFQEIQNQLFAARNKPINSRIISCKLLGTTHIHRIFISFIYPLLKLHFIFEADCRAKSDLIIYVSSHLSEILSVCSLRLSGHKLINLEGKYIFSKQILFFKLVLTFDR